VDRSQLFQKIAIENQGYNFPSVGHLPTKLICIYKDQLRQLIRQSWLELRHENHNFFGLGFCDGCGRGAERAEPAAMGCRGGVVSIFLWDATAEVHFLPDSYSVP
jgi:hypothetical protein